MEYVVVAGLVCTTLKRLGYGLDGVDWVEMGMERDGYGSGLGRFGGLESGAGAIRLCTRRDGIFF